MSIARLSIVFGVFMIDHFQEGGIRHSVHEGELPHILLNNGTFKKYGIALYRLRLDKGIHVLIATGHLSNRFYESVIGKAAYDFPYRKSLKVAVFIDF